MITTAQDEPNGPLAKFRIYPGVRIFKVGWPVGEPTAAGEQKIATLKVSHNSKVGYRAYLSTMYEKTLTDIGPIYRVNLSLHPGGNGDVLIYTRASSRFNNSSLQRACPDAIAELRARYERGDDEVTTFFDPDSPVFAY